MVKAVSRAIGVSNEFRIKCKPRRCLFLDIDTKEYPGTLIYALLHRYNNILILKTKHGWHLISFTPLTIQKWTKELDNVREFLDQQFYEYSIENGYSVLRISEKYSLKDNKVISPKPKYHAFLQHPKGYKAHAGLSLLYMWLYGFKMQPYEFVGEPRVILHFYITGGD